jgi:hypothetical protein
MVSAPHVAHWTAKTEVTKVHLLCVQQLELLAGVPWFAGCLWWCRSGLLSPGQEPLFPGTEEG